jgi:glycosyltransferase involved in cell wall biosynthesis
VLLELVLQDFQRSRKHLVVRIPEHRVRRADLRESGVARRAEGESHRESDDLCVLGRTNRRARRVVDYKHSCRDALKGQALQRSIQESQVVVPHSDDHRGLDQISLVHRLAVSGTVQPDARTRRITRIIARLNIGGPAIQAITLTLLLEDRGYRTRLVRGVEGPDEGTMDHLALELGVEPTLIEEMRRDPGRQDLIALLRLVTILRRDRPHIVHTHAAKAGTLGRLATLIAYPLPAARPVIVHTYHGHSLTGYFSGRTAAFYRRIEQVLARFTDRLVAVSPEVRDDLVGLGIAGPEKFDVIPLGFDLARFTDDAQRGERRAALRREWGIPTDAQLVTLLARLVPIKRVDRFLRVARRLAERPGVRFAIVGDGELGQELRESLDARALGDQIVWAGFRLDVPDVCFASDVVVLTSDNEGTPVSLIEAQAAALPVAGTDVGGVRSAVLDGHTGYLAPADAEADLAAAISQILDAPGRAEAMGVAGRRHATDTFSMHRLVDDLDLLYCSLLTGRDGV